MYGKAAVVLLLSGLLGACMQAPPQTAAAPPPPPPPPIPAATPAPVEAPTGDRIVAIRRATCERFLELSPDDRHAAAMFYVGYQSSRFGASYINVNVIPSIVRLASDYCSAYPNRPAAAAFAYGYREVKYW